MRNLLNTPASDLTVAETLALSAAVTITTVAAGTAWMLAADKYMDYKLKKEARNHAAKNEI